MAKVEKTNFLSTATTADNNGFLLVGHAAKCVKFVVEAPVSSDQTAIEGVEAAPATCAVDASTLQGVMNGATITALIAFLVHKFPFEAQKAGA